MPRISHGNNIQCLLPIGSTIETSDIISPSSQNKPKPLVSVNGGLGVCGLKFSNATDYLNHVYSNHSLSDDSTVAAKLKDGTHFDSGDILSLDIRSYVPKMR